jgi:hypothetical protein
MREYTKLQTILANLPYGFMVFIGTGAIVYGIGFTPLARVAAGCYFVYGIVGTLWVMIFMCPYCNYFDSQGCPCGYGTLASQRNS